MESYKLVLPEHLNHYGYLFGGNLLKWVDELGWIAASLDYPGANFVTVAMDSVGFKQSVRQGTILRFDVKQKQAGTTSAQYTVTVSSEDIETGDTITVFSTNITFVNLDAKGAKHPLPKR